MKRKRTVFGRSRVTVDSRLWTISMRANEIVMRPRYGRIEFKVPLSSIVEEFALEQKLLL